MARRASSSSHTGWVYLVGICLIIALGGGWWITNRSSSPYRTIPSLDSAAYLDNANSLRGNVYQVRGEVQKHLGWSPDGTRIYSVSVDGSPLPIIIPPELKDENLQKGQEFIFKIIVGEGGLIRAQELSKA